MHVTWVGHASAHVQMKDDSVLIDPLGRGRCRDLPHYSSILITHAHVDHLNRWTLKSLNKSATLVVPKGATHIVSDLGFREVLESEPGMHFALGSIDVLAVPTKHDAGRWGKGDTPLCCGYILHQNGIAVHHAGDVDMSTYEIFDQIGRDHKVDATLLPIGAMLPVWYYRVRQKTIDRGVHIDPDTALQIACRIGAKHMIPIHWGTVNLRLGSPKAAPKRLKQVAEESNQSGLIQILGHGESLSL